MVGQGCGAKWAIMVKSGGTWRYLHTYIPVVLIPKPFVEIRMACVNKRVWDCGKCEKSESAKVGQVGGHDARLAGGPGSMVLDDRMHGVPGGWRGWWRRLYRSRVWHGLLPDAVHRGRGPCAEVAVSEGSMVVWWRKKAPLANRSATALLAPEDDGGCCWAGGRAWLRVSQAQWRGLIRRMWPCT